MNDKNAVCSVELQVGKATPVSDQMLQMELRIIWKECWAETMTPSFQLEVLAEFMRRAPTMLAAISRWIEHKNERKKTAPLQGIQEDSPDR